MSGQFYKDTPSTPISVNAMQSQKAVTVYLSSKQLLPFGFAYQHRCPLLTKWPGLFAPSRGTQGKKSVLDNP